jgi:hypothetical protein
VLRRLARLILLLALALGMVRVSAAPVVRAFLECVEGCADDGADGKCSPLCQDCACCARSVVAPARVQAVDVLPIVSHTLLAFQRDRTPPSPEPREILHIPKPARV